MKKIIMLLLSVFVLMSFVNGITFKTYNTAGNLVEISKSFSTKTLVNTLNPFFAINISDIFPVNNQNVSIRQSGVLVGWGIYNKQEIYIYGTITSATTVSLVMSIDGGNNQATRYLSYSVSGPAPPAQTCTTPTCVENIGIVSYTLPNTFPPDSCSNYILSIVTDDPSCPVAPPGPPSTVPTIKSNVGITVKSAGQRTITQKTKIYEVSCTGTGTLVIDMDGYTIYDVYHRGNYVETSSEQEYTITECSNWVFDPSGYISECKGTKTVIFTSLALCGLLAIVFIAFSIMNTVKNDSEGISMSTITALIGFSIALFVGIIIVSNLSSMICGV